MSTSHIKNLALAHRIYGSIIVVGSLGTGLLALLSFLISRTLLQTIIQAILSSYFAEHLLGKSQASEMIGWVITIARFGPLVLALISLLISIVVGLLASLPFFFTAHAVSRQRDWVVISGVITILMSIMVFPIGTVLALYTAWYLIFARPKQ